MSIRPIITFKAGICEVDVSLFPHLPLDIGRVHLLTEAPAIHQTLQGEAVAKIRLYLPLSSIRRWYGNEHQSFRLQLVDMY